MGWLSAAQFLPGDNGFLKERIPGFQHELENTILIAGHQDEVLDAAGPPVQDQGEAAAAVEATLPAFRAAAGDNSDCELSERTSATAAAAETSVSKQAVVLHYHCAKDLPHAAPVQLVQPHAAPVLQEQVEHPDHHTAGAHHAAQTAAANHEASHHEASHHAAAVLRAQAADYHDHHNHDNYNHYNNND